MTFGGKPASMRIWYTSQFDAMAAGDGFHTTTLPIRAGAAGRFPPIAVKLKGEIAYTKPSRGRYSTRLIIVSSQFKCHVSQVCTYFQTPGELCTGCSPYVSSAYLTLNLKKSHSSAAASISACHAFFPCPTIVAAMISYLYLVEIRSAALRKTAARSAKGRFDHDSWAARAASMALLTSSVLAFEYFATTSACDEGLCCVRIEELVIYLKSENIL